MALDINTDALLSKLSNLVYEDEATVRNILLSNSEYSSIGLSIVKTKIDPNTGFAAYAFKDASGKYYTVFRGTDGISDIFADTAIVFETWCDQFSQAAEFTNSIKELVERDPNVSNYQKNIFVSGHSLGATISQIMGKMFGLDGASFDAGDGAVGIVKTDEFAAYQKQFSIDSTNDIASTFNSYIVQGSSISSSGEESLGNTILVPGSDSSSNQLFWSTLTGLIAGSSTAVTTGISLALGTAYIQDQFGNKHSMDQINQYMQMLRSTDIAPGISSSELGIRASTTTSIVNGIEVTNTSSDTFEVFNKSTGTVANILQIGGTIENRYMKIFNSEGMSIGNMQYGTNEDGNEYIVGEYLANRNHSYFKYDRYLTETVRTETVTDGNNSILFQIIESRSNDGTWLSTVVLDFNNQTATESKMVDGQVVKEEMPLSAQKAGERMPNDVASLIMALHSKDNFNIAVYGTKVIADYYLMNNKEISIGAFDGNTFKSLGYAFGIYAGLQALQSKDAITQISGAVGILQSANELKKVLDGSSLYGSQYDEMFATVGAIISVANMRNLDAMIESGQIGSAAATVVGTINAVAYAAEASTALAGSGALITINPVVMVAAVIVLNSIFGHDDPPPPPPFGEAWFDVDSNGKLIYVIGNSNGGGHQILENAMNSLLVKLNAQMASANVNVDDPDMVLEYVASRMAKVHIQSWASYTGNNVSNYYFVLEQPHPQNGQKIYNAIARQDFVEHYSDTLILSEAVVQHWESEHLAMMFGSDQKLWLTEGQYLSKQSLIEQTRESLKAAVNEATKTLEAAKAIDIEFEGGALSGQSTIKDDAIKTAQEKLDQANKALNVYDVVHPIDPQQAALILENFDKATATKEEYIAAMESATQQWMKVIALDWNKDGTIGKTSVPTNVKNDLYSIQNDGNVRFDIDNDGYAEATQWIDNQDMLLGIDRDNNGFLEAASELFNGVSTSFDQRGANSLQYYDANHDGKITRDDPVFKLLRLWIDLNGDGSSGAMEVFDLDMKLASQAGQDLYASLDAAGKAGIDALQQFSVGEIDLGTLNFKLVSGEILQGYQELLAGDINGVSLHADTETNNVGVIYEGKTGDDARENYITFLQDMSGLLELQSSTITPQRRTELEALAVKYGLDPNDEHFSSVVKSIIVGGENVGGLSLPVTLSGNDIWTDEALRTKLEAMRFDISGMMAVQEGDVFGTAKVQEALWSGSGQGTVFDDGWINSRTVSSFEIISDAITPASEVEKSVHWVLPSDVYNLDFIVRGIQWGDIIQQRAVVASDANNPENPAQSVQIYTTAQPNTTLEHSSVNGKEDEKFSFGFLQLEQEAKLLLDAPLSTIRLLGIREVRHGSVVMNDEYDTLDFIPESDYYGNDAGFTYVLSDENGNIIERKVDMNIKEVNDAPLVAGESVEANEDVPLVFDAATLLANDRDKEGDTLSIIGIGRVGLGKAELLFNGQIRYVPPADIYGVTDTVEYIVQDARGATSIATIRINLKAVDDAPTVMSEVIKNAQEDEIIKIDQKLLLRNDYDADYSAFGGNGTLKITAISNAEHGSVFLTTDGTVVFIADEHYNGKAKFDYTVSDETGLSTTSFAEIDIEAVNDAPRVFGETIHTQEDEQITIDVDLLLANDEDIDISMGENQRMIIAGVSNAIGGEVTFDGKHVIFTPTKNYNGNGSFDYVVSDENGGLSTAKVTLDISAVNDAPTMLNRTFQGAEDTPIMIRASDLLAGITDVDGDEIDGLTLSVDGAQGGVITSNFDDSIGEIVYTFTPYQNFNSTATFNYHVKDALGAEGSAVVAIDVSAVNDAPIALPGSKITRVTDEDQIVRISEADILKMFADVDGDVLNVIDLKALNSGDKVEWDTTKKELVFTPLKDVNGIRQISLAIEDSSGLKSGEVTLDITLKALNDAPIVTAFGAEVLEDGGATNSAVSYQNIIYFRDVLAKASDAENDKLTISKIGNISVAGAILTLDSANERILLKTPLNYNGALSFDYTVSDGHGGNTTQTARIMVKAVNDNPDIRFDSIQKNNLKSISGWISTLNKDYYHTVVSDVDTKTTYSYKIETNPTVGGVKLGETLITDISTHQQTVNLTTNDYFSIQKVGGGPTSNQTVAIKATGTDGSSVVGKFSYLYFNNDPIVLDLDRDGLEFVNAQKSGVAFDVNGDGIAEKFSWLSPHDATIVYDYDSDGKLTKFDEVSFWQHLGGDEGYERMPDLQALSTDFFDTNQDGVFDDNDEKWGLFKVWQDANGNGISDDGEMKTMSEAGIEALYLHTNVLNHAYGADAVVRGYTRALMSDGTMLQAGDVSLSIEDAVNHTPSEILYGEAQAISDTELEQEIAVWQAQQEAALKAGDPNFTGGLQTQKIVAGADYRYVLPNHLFNETMECVYDISLTDGSHLPSWLHYDPLTQTLYGTPTLNETESSYNLKVSSFDKNSGILIQSGIFELDVASYNQAPIVFGTMPIQYAVEETFFNLDIAPNFFIDKDSTDELHFQAKLSDGSDLPSWLHFDEKNLRFYGTPTDGFIDDLSIVLLAKDSANAVTSTTFTLMVIGINDAPYVANPIGVVGMRMGEDNRYTIPNNLFADNDAEDSLTILAYSADGYALPSWLHYDIETQTFSGLPTNTDIAEPVQIRLVAIDQSGESVSTILTLVQAQWGDSSNNILIGSDYTEYLFGEDGDDTLDGGFGADKLIGGAGDDTYVVDNIGDIVIENMGEGTDTVQSSITYTLGTNVENLVLTGTAAINGTGNDLNNTITGNSVNNILDGGLGADTMIGGAGNDTYIVDNVGDIVTETSTLATEIDTVQSSITYTLGSNVENLVLTGTAAINGIGNTWTNIIYANDGNNILDGGTGTDTLSYANAASAVTVNLALTTAQATGGSGSDTVINFENLTGSNYNDTLTGTTGNNILNGGAGADTMIGGLGNDTYIVDNVGDIVIESSTLATEIDTVQSSVSYTLGTNVENLTLTGTGAINATGNILNNTLSGNSADNVLDGGLGSDTMKGGTGDDIYIVDDIRDVVIENAGEGIDTVQSSITYILKKNVENLVLTGAADINGTGNDFDNTIYANSGNNILAGGDGADTMIGGLGNDTYIVDDIGDVVIENAGEGTDTVRSSISYTLGSNVENLVLMNVAINGTGNTLNNTLTGNDRNNILDGGLGADMMSGGSGNDTYIVDNVGDIVIENKNDGSDTVKSSITYILGSNVENLVLTGTAAINGTGNTLNNIIYANDGNNILDGGTGTDTLSYDNAASAVTVNLALTTAQATGGSGVDTILNFENLTGSNYNDTLTGTTGNNILDGGAGADKMTGGTGNDTYIVDNVGDIVTETSTLVTEIDTVQSSITYTLGTNVENLVLMSGAINGTGNDLDNAITGNSGNNILDGGAGADTMSGGLGNDTYIVDNVGDIVIENAGEGTDTVQSSISYTLGSNVENLVLTGTAAINGTGNTLNNIIYANNGNNILDGGTGTDTLSYDNAASAVTVNLALTTAQATGGSGSDTVTNFENLTGSNYNDTLTGTTGNNILDGGAGADTMSGGLGNDTYIVDNIGDIVIENANEGTDIVQSSVSYTLGSNVEKLTFKAGTEAINGTGNTLNNTLTGNRGDNVLDGGAGADTMSGVGGDDTYIVDNVGDIVIENAGEGIDTVQSSVSYTLGLNVENLVLTGTAVINGTGNDLDNTITGNSGNNIIEGGYANDNLQGGLGDDIYVFNIGDGVDTIFDNDFGNGIDGYYNAGNDTIMFGEGISTADISIFSSGSDLMLSYGTNDLITITNQSVVNNAIEKFTLSDGNFLTSNDINVIIQSMNSYAADHGISIDSMDTVKNNQDLMNIVSGVWHQ